MIDIHSPEFAQAWRIVSEALLAFVQGLTTTNEPVVPSPAEADAIPPADSSTPPVTRRVSSVRYAARVITQDGNYYMKNLKDTPQENTIIIVNIYDDNTCTFELASLTPEQRQVLKDNLSNNLPSAVATISGEITANGQITTTTKGQGQVNNGRVVITTPMTVEIKN